MGVGLGVGEGVAVRATAVRVATTVPVALAVDAGQGVQVGQGVAVGQVSVSLLSQAAASIAIAKPITTSHCFMGTPPRLIFGAEIRSSIAALRVAFLDPI